MITALAAALLCLIVAAVSWLWKTADAGQTQSLTWLCGQRESVKEETKNRICVYFPAEECLCVGVSVFE